MEKKKNSTRLVLSEEELELLIKERKIKFDVGLMDSLDISGGLYIQIKTPKEDSKN